MLGDRTKCTIEISKEIYRSEDFGIYVADIMSVKTEDSELKPDDSITISGTVFDIRVGSKLHATLEEIEHKTHGKQYNIISIASILNFSTDTKEGQKRFLQSLYPESIITELYKTLSNPYEAIRDKDFAKLVTVRGIAMSKAMSIVLKFDNSIPLSLLYVELEDYGLTTKMLQKLLDTYGSPELAIKKVKENPYSLVEVDGISFGRADEIAMRGGISEFSVMRIQSFIEFYLKAQALNGFSWITCDELMSAIIETIGEGVSDLAISDSIGGMKDTLWWSEDKARIGLSRYRKLEDRIGEELLRIRDAESDFKYDNWEDVVSHIEHKQGWEYASKQRVAIEAVLRNNITCVHGLAGCGKSTIAEAMLEVLKSYSSALTALSGRAAARIAEITGREGYTIHRLLGFPSKSEIAINGYEYNENNHLPYDIIIIDEISMIGGYLFCSLLKAIKSGAKVVLLGDIGQLESIGECNIAYDIINSPSIPTIELDQIYRQAEGSGVISESRKARKGFQLFNKGWVGVKTYGELQDLTIDSYSDKSNTFYKVMQYFQQEIGLVKSIMDIQVISPIKSNGDSCTWSLNNSIQELYNPRDEFKKEIDVFYGKGKLGILREGDKVINIKNNYKATRPSGQLCSIFNGNLGIIQSINTKDGTIVIDFDSIGLVVIPKANLKSIELAYAVTCHKIQGSQAERIIVCLDFSMYTLLSREMVYTAVTRAQKHCTLVCQNAALEYAINKEGVNTKTTHLQDVLYQLDNPKLVDKTKLVF